MTDNTDNKKQKHFPLFTIITVTLNNIEGLRRTCKSIESQTFTDYEWIIIDGSSNDGTPEFIKEKMKEHNKNKTLIGISEPDDGIYDAMNTGLKNATGRYLIFMNAGDILATPDILAKIQPFTEKKPDFICCDSLEGPPKKKETNKDNKPTYKAARRYHDIHWGMITHHQAMIYRRNIARDHKIRYSLIYQIAADYDFTTRFLSHAKKIAYVNRPLCVFEAGGLSQQQAFQGRKEQYIIREKLAMLSQTYNSWILIVQSSSWYIKHISPALYAFLKSNILKFMDSGAKKKAL